MATDKLFIYDKETNLAVCIAKGYSNGWGCEEKQTMHHMSDFFELVLEFPGGLSVENPTRLQLMTEDNIPDDCAIFYSRVASPKEEIINKFIIELENKL